VKSIWEIPFIVVDVETSGSNSKENRIMEIACVVTIGSEITNVFSSLINPHQLIPPFVANMTGISDKMVALAPEANSIMPKVEELFNQKDAVFVAHNASFDWTFVVETFKLAGLPKPKLPRLCTLKLSRRLLPKYVKKNLGELSEHFGITVKNRHRAGGDAVATAHILNELLEMAEQEHDILSTDNLLKFQNKPIRNFRASTSLVNKFENIITELPDTPGIYQFIDDKEKVLFNGKANSIKSRINHYFKSEIMTSKSISAKIRNATNIKCETTDSELSAIILDANLNAQKTSDSLPLYGIHRNFPMLKLTTNEPFPLLELCFIIENDGNEYYGPFDNVTIAYQLMRTIENKYNIRKCSGMLQPSINNKPCYYHKIGQCDAPCVLNTNQAEYQITINNVKNFLNNYTGGAVKQLEQQINMFADRIDSEKATNLKSAIGILKHRLDNRYGISDSTNNFIFLNPISAREKTIELYIIKNNRLIHQQIIGNRADLKSVFTIISNNFFSNDLSEHYSSAPIINISRIIRLYHSRHKEYGKLIKLGNKQELEFVNELIHSIRHLKFKSET